MISYDAPVWRPPSEANSFILQVTLGCSFNRCSFCSMYREKQFRVRPLEEIEREIRTVAAEVPYLQKVFLADGDAIVCDTDHLVQVLELLHTHFKALRRVSSYALPVNLLKKSTAELTRLREAGLGLLFYGMESGSERMLRRITKGATPDVMFEGLEKVRAAGIKVSATVILGLGGKTFSEEHIQGTVELVNRVQLKFLSTLELRLDESVRDEFFKKFREPFVWQDEEGILRELRALVAGIRPVKPLIFRSNHASNALPLGGTLPKDQAALLGAIDEAIDGTRGTVPRWLREHH